MNKLKRVIIAVALLLVIGLPVFLTSCGKVDPKIEITTEFKTEYYVGEKLDVTGGILTYTDENGKESFVSIEEKMLTGFSSATVGTRKMVLSYKDLTILVDYVIKESVDIPLNTLFWCEDTKAVWGEGQNLYLYHTGDSEYIYLTVSGYSPSTMNEDLDSLFLNAGGVKYPYEKTDDKGAMNYRVLIGENGWMNFKAVSDTVVTMTFGEITGETVDFNYNFVKYVPGNTLDVSKDVLYWCEDTEEAFGENQKIYVYFDKDTTDLYMTVNSYTPAEMCADLNSLLLDDFGSTYSYTKSEKNDVIIYTVNEAFFTGIVTIKPTNQNTINVVSKEGDEIVFEYNFVKYAA